MKRILGFATAAALVVGASGVQAQEGPSRFDLGVYGGYSWTSDWFEFNDADFGIGWNPIFGASGTYWISEALGVRLHGAYMPSSPPLGETNTGVEIPTGLADADYPVNNWFGDLNVAFRPWWSSNSNLLSSMYMWLGGGFMTSNFAGGGNATCVPDYIQYDTCVSFDSDYGTVGQGTAGLGVDLISLTRNIGLFAELGAHVYDSPTHVLGEDNDNNIGANDKYAVTARGSAGLKFSFGEFAPPVVPIPPPPPPPPPPAERQIQVCVVQDGQLQMVTATFRPETNDTLINGQRFSQVHPATAPNYAAGANWFIQQNEITFNNQTWVKYGVTRVIQPPSLQRIGEVNGTSVFAEAGQQAPYEVIYVPVRPGCEFQAYQLRETIRPRG